jgi:hypothetical protein
MLASRLRTVLSLLVAVAAVGLGPLALHAQSLADVAKKEEERRKTVPAPAKVYTNKDLTAPAAGSTPTPAPSGTATTPAPDAAKDAKDAAKDSKDKEPAKDQAYWSSRLKTLRDKLERDSTYADAIQTRVNSLTADFVNRDDPAQRAALERDRQKALSELARLKQDMANGKKAIADLQEEARRAGVPPGWLR